MAEATEPDREAENGRESGVGGDRRRAERHASVLLVGRICSGGGEAACLVHDISAHGLMARFPLPPPAVGETVRVAVRGMAPAAATVRWVRGSKAGLQFRETQDLGEALGQRLEEGWVRRAPRFPVGAATTLRVDGSWRVVELIDLSAGGAKLSAGPLIGEDLPAQLSLPSVAMPVHGNVCWHKADRMGLRFVTPLTLPELSAVLSAMALSGEGQGAKGGVRPPGPGGPVPLE